jgi:mannitol/fructose-specific phosphotransferase system IIA component (Ntr-type)
VLWDEETGARAQLVVLLLSPLADHGEHLRLLAALARLLKDPRTCESLKAAPSPADLLERVRRCEAARVL